MAQLVGYFEYFTVEDRRAEAYSESPFVPSTLIFFRLIFNFQFLLKLIEQIIILRRQPIGAIERNIPKRVEKCLCRKAEAPKARVVIFR